ncbi:hypothetical protein KFK09_008794 [Dendrobium nobile]|uniref:RING-type domain-containing protein n=1 Tax=Dendrobium nobile TaxID=94219 RepID=A0A8T3BQ29_DENNO|nr:hypothetical protein KFK09_008794 [Dendrobium nobile]
MGLSNHLSDLSGGSILILLVTVASAWLSFLRSLHLHRPAAPRLQATGYSSPVAAEQLKACRPYNHISEGEEEAECAVCLCGIRTGERVRRLGCYHLFHSECLDGWIRGSNPTCPLCRSPLLAEEQCAAVESRIAAEYLPWFSTH